MVREVPVTAARDVPEALLRSVRGVLCHHATLQDVLEWCQRQTPPRDLADVVVQDEFTHDIVVEHSLGLFAVYDTT